MTVNSGEVFGFLGPNGAGKTTTIRMIVGLMKISSGEILINGISVKENFEKAMAHVGAIVENPEMYKFLSGYDNLKHYARMVSSEVSDARINEVVDLVGLNNRIKDKVKSYSLGMRQRLGLAQALLHNPTLLILDEPTNGLDPAGIRELRDHLRKLAKEEGISVLVSSHLLSEMELMCDRVAIIQNGKLIDIQPVRDLEESLALLTVAFKVDQLEKAQTEISQLIEKEVLIKDDMLIVQLKQDEIPTVNKALVQAEIGVFGISTVSQSLEDKFLQITGGEEIV
ncbi:bacitracin ABC transporter ATP-binding protein [Lottiidibacillus patelloidae]|uniref:Bacitracin ABC transporter ATP-binding protein n=2 Tax=Lottiidibacillus patelloidae TaxID=2670334 RepID=A0A263BW17_9BACI|nr:bacitracin ABC transporter ATP-binding protein [Lottiidibacillus patelloidae]